MKEVIFRNFFTEYTDRDRLRSYVPIYYMFTPEIVVLKELLDNAADAVEENKSYKIEIALIKNTISIKNLGVIPERVFNKEEFTKGFMSSKSGFKAISRGLVGHGLKIAICLALLYLNSPLLVIESGENIYEFTKAKNTDTGDITLSIEKSLANNPSNYTSVNWSFVPLISDNYSAAKQYVYQYILLNPHITFRLQENESIKIFERVREIKINKKADITQYSKEEFCQLYFRYQKGVKNFSLGRFLSNFNVPSTHLKKLSELKSSKPEKIYKFIQTHSEKVRLPEFKIGFFSKRLENLNSDLKILSHNQELDKNENYFLLIFSTPNNLFDLDSNSDKIIFSYNGSILSPKSIQYYNEANKNVNFNVEYITSKLPDKRLFFVFYSKNLQTHGKNKENIIIPFNLSKILKEFIKKEAPPKSTKKQEGFLWITPEKRKEYESYSISKQTDILLISFPNVNKLTVKHYFINEAYKILKNAYDKYGPISIRSLYYQLVAQKVIISDQNSYRFVVEHLTDARKEGYIPWDMFIDDSRPFYPPPPSTSLEIDPSAYFKNRLHSILKPPTTFDLWEKLKIKVEVWVEKVAMIPILEPIADKYFVGIQPAKGFSSGTLLNNAVKKVTSYVNRGYKFYIFYFGDFNPSGISIWENIKKKLGVIPNTVLKKLAVNQNQFHLITVSPEPPKPGDTRTPKFIKKYGDKCYDLEAFDFDSLRELLENELTKLYQTEQFTPEINRWLTKFNKIKDLLLENLKNTSFFNQTD